jgi:hypothetical protein
LEFRADEVFWPFSRWVPTRREADQEPPEEVRSLITRARKVLVTLFASAMLVGGAAAPAIAQVQQDGLVNVSIGDITIEDVNVGIAALVAATVCEVQVGPVAVLGVAVDRSGDSTTICETDAGDVVLSQN